jgi:predicted Zn-dependent protease
VRPEKRPASPRTSPSQQARIGAIALRSVAVALALLVGAYGLTRLSIADRLSAPEPTAAQRAADLWRVDAFLYYNASIRWGYAAQQTPEVHQKQLDLVAIRRAVSLEPANGLYQLESARTLVSYGMPQAEVEAAYRKAIELAPASPAALSSYAEYLISLGRKQEAKLLLDEAMRLARSTEAARVYAEYYRATGDEADALRYDALQREIAGALAQPGGAQP